MIRKTTYGKTPSGVNVDQYFLINKNNMEVGIITYGGIITCVKVSDRNAIFEDVVLGFDAPNNYLALLNKYTFCIFA